MRKIKTYRMFEEYISNPVSILQTTMTDMSHMFKDSFGGGNDVLGSEELSIITLVDVQMPGETSLIDKTITLEFSDEEYYYNVAVTCSVNDVKDDGCNRAMIRIKIYGDEDGTLLKTWDSPVEMHVATGDESTEEGRFFVKVKDDASEMDFIENFIIGKIGNMKEQFNKNKQQE